MGTENELMSELSRAGTNLPRHIAIIMDGNGRWAKKRFLPRIVGHQEGVKSVRMAVETAGKLGIQYLSLYAFSTENWSRPKDEVNGLMTLLRDYLRREVKKLKKNNVRLSAVGRTHELPAESEKELRKAIAETRDCGGLNLVLALNYSGKTEILDAVNKALEQVTAGPLSESKFKSFFYLPELPDVDLLIRTSGEMRISNFMLWQCAYSEIYVTPRFWPEFRKIDFLRAIQEYTKRERRYGGV
ncbi:MAG: isoprenyl transferase [Candidatus Wallbacteria bacterium]|nr:isoprenyl transferase [Candidatus Wallbacteria bacterium]